MIQKVNKDGFHIPSLQTGFSRVRVDSPEIILLPICCLPEPEGPVMHLYVLTRFLPPGNSPWLMTKGELGFHFPQQGLSSDGLKTLLIPPCIPPNPMPGKILLIFLANVGNNHTEKC